MSRKPSPWISILKRNRMVLSRPSRPCLRFSSASGSTHSSLNISFPSQSRGIIMWLRGI